MDPLVALPRSDLIDMLGLLRTELPQDFDPKAFHHRERHIDVRFRYQGAFDSQVHILLAIGCCHQHAAEELARYIPSDSRCPTA